MTTQGGFAAFESPDGRFVYYAKLSDPGLWRVPVEGGEEVPVLERPAAGYWGHWAVVEEGIYLIDAETSPGPAIEFFSFATRRVTRVAVLEKETDKGISALAVSPDGRWVLYNQVDQGGSDIVLAENFR